MSQGGILSTENVPSHLATSYPTDSGTAVPESNILNIFGGNGVSTTASGNTITIDIESAVSVTFNADSGTATPSSNELNIFGTSSQGITSSATGNTLTFTIADATTTTKGVAFFNSSHFSVSSGAVSLVTPLAVTYGGTGGTTFRQYAVLLGNLQGVFTEVLGLGASGQLLTSNGNAAPPTWQNPAYTGDVVGPSSSTDNAVVRWDGTTGKLVQDSSVLIDDSDNVTGVTSLTIDGSSGNTLVVNSTDLVVNSSANKVGIKESSPSNVLSVKGEASIGSSYSTTSAPTDGLIIQGNVGIGETSPGSKLSVAGSASIGSSYSTTAAPSNGLIVQGQVGIADASPGSAYVSITPAIGSGSILDAVSLIPTFTNDTSDSYTASYIGPIFNPSSSVTYTDAIAQELVSNVLTAGAAVITNIYSLKSSVEILTSNTVTSCYNSYIKGPNVSSGTVTTCTSLYVTHPTTTFTGSITNDYTAVIGDDSSALVGIGETAPASMLSVAGGGSFGSSYSTTAAPSNGLIIEGQVGIADSSPGVNYVSITPTISSGSVGNAVYVAPVFSVGSAGSYSSISSTCSFAPTAAITYSNIYSLKLIGGASPGASATITNIYGIYSTLSSSVTNTVSASYGAYIAGSNSVSGTITNAYGLYVKAPYTSGSGAITNKYTAILGEDSTALVGIGVTNPKNTLTIEGNCSIGSSYSGTTGPSNGLIVEGNVGIGESSPGSKLSVSGNMSVGASYDTTAAPTNGMIVEGNIGAGKNSASSKIHIAAATSSVASLIMDEGTLLSSPVSGAIEYDGTDLYYTDNTTTRHALAKSVGNVTGPGSSTDNAIARWDGTSGDLIQNSAVIIDDSDNVTGVTSLTIDGSSGNTLVVNSTDLVVDSSNNRIGIGISSPQNNVHIFGAAPSLKLSTSTTANPGVDFATIDFHYNPGYDAVLAQISGARDAFNDDGALIFKTRDGSTNTLDTAMYINQDQEVGIGTTSPANLLAVAGSASIGSSYATTSAPTNGMIVEGTVAMGSSSADGRVGILYGEKLDYGDVTSDKFGALFTTKSTPTTGSTDDFYTLRAYQDLDTTTAASTGGGFYYPVNLAFEARMNSSTGTNSVATQGGARFYSHASKSSGTVTTNVGSVSFSYVGSATTNTSNYAVVAFSQYTSSNNSTNNYGVYSTARTDSSGNVTTQCGLYTVSFQSGTSTITSNYGIYAQAYNEDSSGAITTNYGGYFYANKGTAGAITNNYGVYCNARTSHATGTISVNAGLYAEARAPTTGSSISSNYGAKIYTQSNTGTNIDYNYTLFISDTHAGTVNNNWSIYNGSATHSYFNGRLGLGTPTPATQLDVNGTVTALGIDIPGVIAQVVSTTKTDPFSSSTTLASGGAAVTDLSVSITPQSTSSKIYIMVSMNVATSATTFIGAWIARGSTKIGTGTPDSNRLGITGRFFDSNTNVGGSIAMSYLDSPSTTSSTTYNVYVATEAAASVYVNRTSADTDNDGAGARGSSTITVFEVLA